MSTCKRVWSDRQIRSMADESAKIRIEAGLTENAKPIYCHPISISKSNVCYITCLIFNNSTTAFTLTTFKKYIDDLKEKVEVVRIMASGFYKTETEVIIMSLIGKYENVYMISGGNASTGASTGKDSADFTAVIPSDATFNDGVNKIN